MNLKNHSRATLGARYGDQRRRRDSMRAQLRFYRGMFGPSDAQVEKMNEATRRLKETAN